MVVLLTSMVLLTFMFISPYWHFKSKLKHHPLSYHNSSFLKHTFYGLFALLKSQHEFFIILETSFTQNMKFRELLVQNLDYGT